jgi:hypothetical protein
VASGGCLSLSSLAGETTGSVNGSGSGGNDGAKIK